MNQKRPLKKPGTKGEATRDAILRGATELASVEGLNGISIGALAAHTGMSKSGLFAHFGSKEALQLAVIDAVRDDFIRAVVEPARQFTGERRLRALTENWFEWNSTGGYRGGCPLVAAAVEWDDRDGPVRDEVQENLALLQGYLQRAAEKAVEAGDFREDLDPEQFAHDVFSILLGFHHSFRLLRSPKAGTWARAAVDRLLDASRRQPGAAGTDPRSAPGPGPTLDPDAESEADSGSAS